MRKVGAIVPIWNSEIFIGPHFELLSTLDKCVVMPQSKPLGDYAKQHGYTNTPDRSIELIRSYFPNVIVLGQVESPTEFGADLYNPMLQHVRDMDIVFRLDPDMFWEKKDWNLMVDYIKETENDAYFMNFADKSINYYLTGSFDYGVKDAQESDTLAFSPNQNLEQILHYPAHNLAKMDFDNWTCHHFRGWGKPKSTDSVWEQKKQQFIDGGYKFYSAPDEIRKNLKSWLKEIKREEVLK